MMDRVYLLLVTYFTPIQFYPNSILNKASQIFWCHGNPSNWSATASGVGVEVSHYMIDGVYPLLAWHSCLYRAGGIAQSFGWHSTQIFKCHVFTQQCLVFIAYLWNIEMLWMKEFIYIVPCILGAVYNSTRQARNLINPHNIHWIHIYITDIYPGITLLDIYVQNLQIKPY